MSICTIVQKKGNEARLIVSIMFAASTILITTSCSKELYKDNQKAVQEVKNLTSLYNKPPGDKFDKVARRYDKSNGSINQNRYLKDKDIVNPILDKLKNFVQFMIYADTAIKNYGQKDCHLAAEKVNDYKDSVNFNFDRINGITMRRYSDKMGKWAIESQMCKPCYEDIDTTKLPPPIKITDLPPIVRNPIRKVDIKAVECSLKPLLLVIEKDYQVLDKYKKDMENKKITGYQRQVLNSKWAIASAKYKRDRKEVLDIVKGIQMDCDLVNFDESYFEPGSWEIAADTTLVRKQIEQFVESVNCFSDKLALEGLDKCLQPHIVYVLLFTGFSDKLGYTLGSPNCNALCRRYRKELGYLKYTNRDLTQSEQILLNRYLAESRAQEINSYFQSVIRMYPVIQQRFNFEFKVAYHSYTDVGRVVSISQDIDLK